jgi:predicted dehydrogenase
MRPRPTRRQFLQTSAALGAAGFWPGLAPAQDKKPAANDRLHVGVIGVTRRGGENLNGVVEAGVEVVALCDVDEALAGKVRERFPKATFCTDYRRMFDQKGLNAVVVSTPDHSHAPATVLALKAGLHVYCEKPLTHTVHEARVVAELAAKQKRVTQMGTQIHAGTNYRRVVELIQAGAIGAVREVHTWCGRSWGGAQRPPAGAPIPNTLDWDLWLGPAPQRPYAPEVYHPFNWRGWWDFGGGTLADMACHHMDLPFWALNLRVPEKVWAEGAPSPADAETAARWVIVHYEFPARDKLPPVHLTWYDGGKRPKHFDGGGLPKWGDGNLFVGKKGMLLADYTRHRLLPEKTFEGYQPPKPTIPDSLGHHKEWVEACKTGGATTCNFDYAGPLTEAVLLGNVAYRLGKPITWDAKNLKAVNEPGADKYLRKAYRKGWSV